MYLVTDEARDGLYLQEVCVMHPQVQKMSVCLFVVSENKKIGICTCLKTDELQNLLQLQQCN